MKEKREVKRNGLSFELVFKRIFYKAKDIGQVRTTEEVELTPFSVRVDVDNKEEAQQIGKTMVNKAVAFNERLVELLEVKEIAK